MQCTVSLRLQALLPALLVEKDIVILCPKFQGSFSCIEAGTGRLHPIRGSVKVNRRLSWSDEIFTSSHAIFEDDFLQFDLHSSDASPQITYLEAHSLLPAALQHYL